MSKLGVPGYNNSILEGIVDMKVFFFFTNNYSIKFVFAFGQGVVE